MIATGVITLHSDEDRDDRRLSRGAALHPLPGLGVRRAGLYAHEKKLVVPLIVSTPSSSSGMAFCCFVVFHTASKRAARSGRAGVSARSHLNSSSSAGNSAASFRPSRRRLAAAPHADQRMFDVLLILFSYV